MNDPSSKSRWASRMGVVLAVSGSAVGLGNFLRFPGQVAANGGGAFMIPYFVALVLVGIPLGWVEWTLGRFAGARGLHSAPAILGALGMHPALRYLGAIGVLIPLVVSFYYTFIEAWCLRYAIHFLTGGIGLERLASIEEQTAEAVAFHGRVAGLSEHGQLLHDGGATLAAWGFAFGLNVFFVWRGLSRGIEKVCLFGMPVIALCAVVVLARVLTSGTPDPALPEQNVSNGLGFMWNPTSAALLEPETWLRAAGQVFFSLSVGFGVIINYASYLRRDDDVVLSGLTAASTNELFEVVFGGLITVTAAFVFLGAAGTAVAVASGSFGLGFHALPVVFAQMGELGNLVGATWFFMLFLAALTSSLSMYQPVVAFVMEATGRSRGVATAWTVALCAIGSGIVLYFSEGAELWGALDEWAGTLLIFLFASVQLLVFAWGMGVDRGLDEAHRGAKMRIPRWYRPVLRYVAPGYLLVVFGAFCWKNLPEWVAATWSSHERQGAVALILVVLALLTLFVRGGRERLRPQPEGDAP